MAVGSSGADYDEIGRPEASSGGRLLFAGEHTCKEHPDTVGGAMMTGWRAARQALHLMTGEAGEPFDEVFKLLTLEELAGVDSEDDSDADSGSDSDGEDGEGRAGRRKNKKKTKAAKKKHGGEGKKDKAGRTKASKKRRRKGGEDGNEEDGGPEDDEAAQERARRRLEQEAQARLEQLRREAKVREEMGNGKRSCVSFSPSFFFLVPLLHPRLRCRV